MKTICVLAFCFAVGCGSGECDGDHVGEWQGVTIADKISFGGDCVFEYQGLGGCACNGTYGAPLADSGTVKVDIDSSTGGLCRAVGTYSCDYGINDSRLSISCDGGFPTTYER